MQHDDVSPIEEVFNEWEGLHRRVIGLLADDVEETLQQARKRYREMIPDLAYKDKPDHFMALPLFICSGCLAVGLTLRDQGVGLHTYGKTYLEVLADTPSAFDDMLVGEALREIKKLGEQSQRDSSVGEFVFEISTEEPDVDYAMSIKSCAICHQFRKFDAMELVPYMCASDDVFSDRGDQGLRRTGTIALGAHQCDFRYKGGGKPRPLAPAYPEKIRIATG